jgi:hypothetical protein
LQFIFEETKKQIWDPRCEAMKQLERRYGITKEDKKKPDSLLLEDKQAEITNRPVVLDRRYETLEGVKEYILFGKEILGFTVVVNQVGKIIRLLQPFLLFPLF